MSPALSFANAGNATSIAAAMTTVPIILTMVTSQTYAFYPMFKLGAEKDEALQRCLFSSTGASRTGIYNRPALAPASTTTTSCLRSAGLCSFSGKFDRILLKVMLQFRVQSWVASAKHYRPLKKSLDRHREKFCWILRAISIEQCRNAGFISSTERCKLGSHHFAPGQLLSARRQRRRAVRRQILVVELVSKFMEDNILTVGRIGCSGLHRVPRQHH